MHPESCGDAFLSEELRRDPHTLLTHALLMPQPEVPTLGRPSCLWRARNVRWAARIKLRKT